MSFHCLLSNQSEDCFGCSLLRQQLFELTLKVVKNLNWREADQLDITYTNCSQGTTKKLKTNLLCITRQTPGSPDYKTSTQTTHLLLLPSVFCYLISLIIILELFFGHSLYASNVLLDEYIASSIFKPFALSSILDLQAQGCMQL